jgi:hypothetical protein
MMCSKIPQLVDIFSASMAAFKAKNLVANDIPGL